MSYQQFSIPPSVIADLYKSNLVIVDNEVASGKSLIPNIATPQAQEQRKQWFLGDNKRNITILVNDPQNTYLDESSFEFLSKMLGACKLNIADVAIVNFAKTEVPLQVIKDELHPVNLLFFGVEPSTLLPFSFPQYKLQTHDGCGYLWSVSLEAMRGNDSAAKLEKSKLWVCLKEIFNV
jgi:hypothetical protein